MLLPRYVAKETAIAERLELTDIQDGGVLKGFKAIKSWFADIMGLGGRKTAPICGV
jgi:hypothetical protein